MRAVRMLPLSFWEASDLAVTGNADPLPEELKLCRWGSSGDNTFQLYLSLCLGDEVTSVENVYKSSVASVRLGSSGMGQKFWPLERRENWSSESGVSGLIHNWTIKTGRSILNTVVVSVEVGSIQGSLVGKGSAVFSFAGLLYHFLFSGVQLDHGCWWIMQSRSCWLGPCYVVIQWAWETFGCDLFGWLPQVWFLARSSLLIGIFSVMEVLINLASMAAFINGRSCKSLG